MQVQLDIDNLRSDGDAGNTKALTFKLDGMHPVHLELAQKKVSDPGNSYVKT